MPDQAHPNTADEAAGLNSLAHTEQVSSSYNVITVHPQSESLEGDAHSSDPEKWYLGPEVDHQLQLRCYENVDFVVKNMLERYFSLLALALKTLTSTFNRDEVGLMLDASCGTLYGGATAMSVFPYQIEDAIAYEYLDQKWGVDGKALVAKVNELDYTSRATLIDAIERWWIRVLREEGDLEIEVCLTMP